MTTEALKRGLERAKHHRAADMLVAGTFGFHGDWQGRGCSVGCFAAEVTKSRPSAIHLVVAQDLGVPEWVVRLQDTMFEGLPEPDRFDWHVQIIETYGKVTDWPLALHRVHSVILGQVLKTAGQSEGVVKVVKELHDRAASGQNASETEWEEAAQAARASSWSAEQAAREQAAKAARAAAWSAEKTAAWSAESAARSAAWSAAASKAAASEAAELAATRSAYQSLRDVILVALPTPEDTK